MEDDLNFMGGGWNYISQEKTPRGKPRPQPSTENGKRL